MEISAQGLGHVPAIRAGGFSLLSALWRDRPHGGWHALPVSYHAGPGIESAAADYGGALSDRYLAVQSAGEPLGGGRGALCHGAGGDHLDAAAVCSVWRAVAMAAAAGAGAAAVASGHGDRFLSVAAADAVAVSAVLFSLRLEPGIFPHEHERTGFFAGGDGRAGAAFVTRGVVALPAFARIPQRADGDAVGGICRLAEGWRDWRGGVVGVIVRADYLFGFVGAVLWEEGVLIRTQSNQYEAQITLTTALFH